MKAHSVAQAAVCVDLNLLQGMKKENLKQVQTEWTPVSSILKMAK